MAIQHADIVDPFIHEPKGAGSAGADTVYTANGGGSGSWQKVGVNTLDTVSLYADIQDELDNGTMAVTGRGYMTQRIRDISAADEDGSVIIPLIRDCKIIGASFVLGGAIADNNATVTVKNSAGASMGTPVTVTYAGSARGDQYNFTATGNNEIVGPSWIEVSSDGASTNSVSLDLTLEFEYVINEAP